VMKRFFALFGDLLFYAFHSGIGREPAGYLDLDDQAIYEADYGGSGIGRRAAVSNVMMWNANSTFGLKVGICLTNQRGAARPIIQTAAFPVVDFPGVRLSGESFRPRGNLQIVKDQTMQAWKASTYPRGHTDLFSTRLRYQLRRFRCCALH